jgi:hypothetical protein
MVPSHRNTGANTSITNESLLSTLKNILIKIGTRVTIVVDALDECKEDDQEFVESSVSLCRDIPSLKVVITSRPELNIVDRFKKISSVINIQLGFSRTESNHDIDLYIEQRLQNSKTLGDKMFPEMTQEIREKLRKKADVSKSNANLYSPHGTLRVLPPLSGSADIQDG